jgi:hypothetical protein
VSSRVDPHREVCSFDFFGTFLDDRRVPFAFLPDAGYGIPRVASVFAEAWWDGLELVVVTHCPWCGRRLEANGGPSDLDGV